MRFRKALETIFNWMFFACGVLLVFFGAYVCITTPYEVYMGISEYDFATDFIGFIIAGLLPLVVGVWLIKSPFEAKSPDEAEE